jgi:hypothetical protein
LPVGRASLEVAGLGAVAAVAMPTRSRDRSAHTVRKENRAVGMTCDLLRERSDGGWLIGHECNGGAAGSQ